MTNKLRIAGWLCTVLLGMKTSSLAAGAPHPDEDTVEQVRLWSRGSRKRQVVDVPDASIKRPANTNTVSGKGKNGQSVSEFTVSGTYSSMLPIGDGRIFFASDSQLVYRRLNSSREIVLRLPESLDGREAQLSELLAASITGDSLLLLALVERNGKKDTDLWELTIKGDVISHAELAPDRPEYKEHNPQAFLRKFQVPRCRSGGHDCLQLTVDQGIASIDVVPKFEDSDVQEAPVKRLFSMGRDPVYDYAWSPDGKKILVLWRSPTKKG